MPNTRKCDECNFSSLFNTYQEKSVFSVSHDNQQSYEKNLAATICFKHLLSFANSKTNQHQTHPSCESLPLFSFFRNSNDEATIRSMIRIIPPRKRIAKSTNSENCFDCLCSWLGRLFEYQQFITIENLCLEITKYSTQTLGLRIDDLRNEVEKAVLATFMQINNTQLNKNIEFCVFILADLVLEWLKHGMDLWLEDSGLLKCRGMSVVNWFRGYIAYSSGKVDFAKDIFCSV
ncbi:hypothetical protein HK096_010511, partial [Nowakowskiella sp. JEL0078]